MVTRVIRVVDATARLSDQVDGQLRTINELNNIVSDHERTISRLMGDLKNADHSFAEYREKFAQVHSTRIRKRCRASLALTRHLLPVDGR